MKKYPILTSGEKLVTEDTNAIAIAAGTADDAVHASMVKVFVEDSERKGWVRPWHDGPLVVPSGSDGKVKVQPFTMFMSPKGATSSAGGEDASGGSETTADLKSARYEGGTISIPTPLPTAGNMRWDLLYATISEADSDAASRLVASVSGGTKTVAVSTINTRHGSSVTLAWQQGTSSSTATDPYPLVNMPSLPVASAGTANVPLAYVQVQNSGTPSTVQYTVDRIANAARLARQNPQTGPSVSAAAVAAGKVSATGAFVPTVVSVLTTASAQGGWAPTGTNIRPVRFMEPLTGGLSLWIPVGPFSTTAGNKTFGSTFGASALIKIASPTLGSAFYDDKPWDWRNRFFHSFLNWTTVGVKFAWDYSATTTARMPTSFQTTGVGAIAPSIESWGNSIHGNANFDSLFVAGYYLAAYFPDVTGAGADDDIALIVDNATGDLYLRASSVPTRSLPPRSTRTSSIARPATISTPIARHAVRYAELRRPRAEASCSLTARPQRQGPGRSTRAPKSACRSTGVRTSSLFATPRRWRPVNSPSR